MELHAGWDVVVVGGVEGEVEMIAAGVGTDGGGGVHAGDDEELYVGIVLVVVVELLDGGHFCDALDAPGTPEIEEDDLAFGGGEVDGLAVEGAVNEVGGGLWVVDEVRRLLVGGDLVDDELQEGEASDDGEEDEREDGEG